MVLLLLQESVFLKVGVGCVTVMLLCWGRGTVVVGVGGHGSSVFVSIHVKGGMVVQGAWLEVVSGWQLAVASLW